MEAQQQQGQVEAQQQRQKMDRPTLGAFLRHSCKFAFTEAEVETLFAEGFTTESSLRGVTRDDLAGLELRAAAVKMLISTFSTAALFNSLWTHDAEEEGSMPDSWRAASGAEKTSTREPRL
ncbi:hypothetical protein TSOC_003504 [Tetrabaena socialis]|uniref:Uncharacterized protein n=1 Tax=Tetrabaena socialis TaxID=47790 RepID=A0A2J8ABI6_9CHLO|nr:hypothetical protein TSOC_003504 [Tetrabaena socialis]|eukprot:PNH09833.1 hypothetical protein TSOC_003504 [Tetrabaena socialis]